MRIKQTKKFKIRSVPWSLRQISLHLSCVKSFRPSIEYPFSKTLRRLGKSWKHWRVKYAGGVLQILIALEPSQFWYESPAHLSSHLSGQLQINPKSDLSPQKHFFYIEGLFIVYSMKIMCAVKEVGNASIFLLASRLFKKLPLRFQTRIRVPIITTDWKTHFNCHILIDFIPTSESSIIRIIKSTNTIQIFCMGLIRRWMNFRMRTEWKMMIWRFTVLVWRSSRW